METRTPEFRLIHGDCAAVLRTLDAETVDLVVTSPPYNCQKNYSSFSDQKPWPDYYRWIEGVIAELYRVLVPGGVLAINVPGVIRWQHNHRYAHTWSDFDPKCKVRRDGVVITGRGRIEPIGFKIFSIMQKLDSHVREPIIWVKGRSSAISNARAVGSDSNPMLRSAHEFILLGSKQRWFHRGGTGRRGRNAVPLDDLTKDVWIIPPVGSRLHPAVFPVEIPLRLIRLFTHAEDSVVLDPFMGIGTTGVAAMCLGRNFIGIELSREYLNAARERIEAVQRRGRYEQTSLF